LIDGGQVALMRFLAGRDDSADFTGRYSLVNIEAQEIKASLSMIGG